MVTDVKKKPITKILRGMKIGQTESWDIVRLDTVRVLANRLSAVHRREGLKFKTKIVGLTFEVTRVS